MNDHTPNSDKIPYGYCQCGCEQKTRIAKYNDRKHGWVRGEPIRYINGHSGRKPPASHKQCTKCDEVKPATPEFFHRAKSMYDGLASACKTCLNKAGQEKYKGYYEANRERMVEKSRRWYSQHKEEAAEYVRRRSAETKAKIAEKKRRYRAENKDKIAEYNRKWRTENKGVMRAHKHRRRARQRNAPGRHTAADVKRQHKAQKGKCYYCGCKVGNDYHVDHVIPLIRGGSDGPENIVIACQFCNISKKDKLPHEWGKSNRLL